MESPKQSKKTPQWVFPEPLIIPPSSPHKQTFIILHGLGSNASDFAKPLLTTATPSGETIQTAFPHAKLIFLTASRNRATIYNRSMPNQWFDHWHMDPVEESTKNQGLMVPGLNKSCSYVHGFLRTEIEAVGEKNVVLWGLSQGAATSLVSLLSWDGKAFAAVVGMCSYLPFADKMEGIMTVDEDLEDDLFEAQDGEEADGGVKDLPLEAVTFLRDEINMGDKTGVVFRDVPVFLGHGTEDAKLDIFFGQEAKRCLDLLGADVALKEYRDLGHWYSEAMLEDAFAFLKKNLE